MGSYHNVMKGEFLSAVVVLLLVTDPFGNVPVVNAMLAGVPPPRRRAIIVRECAIATAIQRCS
jgi:small neutral amino acid transporter SnatA (MarC family)